MAQAGRAAVAEAHDVALRLERELEIAALPHEHGQLASELPQPLDVRAEALDADGREAEVGHQRELRARAFECAGAHVLVARIGDTLESIASAIFPRNRAAKKSYIAALRETNPSLAPLADTEPIPVDTPIALPDLGKL